MKASERVAKAIYALNPHLDQGVPVPWDELRGPLRDSAFRIARAAIEAIAALDERDDAP
jgi:hypothetical protein